MKKTCCCIALASSLSLSLSGCGADGGIADPAVDARHRDISTSTDRFSEWSKPVTLGSEVNSSSNETAPTMSKDGLSLYFASNRPGGLGRGDIYVSQRESIDDPWGAPRNIGRVVNSTSNEGGAHLSRDGHWLFFTSGRPGGLGGHDLYRSWRADIHDDFAWGPPENLGTPLNSKEGEFGPSVWGPEFYFFHGPSPTLFRNDIYMSRMTGNSFGVPVPVTALNTEHHEEKPSIRFDGREIIFATNRAVTTDGAGTMDLWYSTRSGNGQEWSAPRPISTINSSSSNERRATLSADGTMLFFDSDRAGGSGEFDLYVSTRTIGGREPRQ